MNSAQYRTLPLPGIEPPPEPKPRHPSIRTLRRKLCDAALAWYRDPSSTTHLEFYVVVDALDQRMKEQ